jgi:hypothetical protein
MRATCWSVLVLLAVAFTVGCDSSGGGKSSTGVGGQANTPQGGGKIEIQKKGNSGPAGGGDN